jgi:hypothetical protein
MRKLLLTLAVSLAVSQAVAAPLTKADRIAADRTCKFPNPKEDPKGELRTLCLDGLRWCVEQGNDMAGCIEDLGEDGGPY